jgi:hypothetical protein
MVHRREQPYFRKKTSSAYFYYIYGCGSIEKESQWMTEREGVQGK